MKTLKPPRLRRGDVIGLISPASAPLPAEKIEKGVRYLERLGYRVKPGEHVAAQRGYFIIDEVLSSVKASAVEGFQYGHVARKLTLPIGLRARLDADGGTLTVLESAVE